MAHTVPVVKVGQSEIEVLGRAACDLLYGQSRRPYAVVCIAVVPGVMSRHVSVLILIFTRCLQEDMTTQIALTKYV